MGGPVVVGAGLLIFLTALMVQLAVRRRTLRAGGGPWAWFGAFEIGNSTNTLAVSM